jgi:8-oxo-dGTP diphosphatase
MARRAAPIRAAGVVLLRDGSAPEVCVLHRPRQQDWSLPKGKLDPGETHVEAARRETVEETGSDVVMGAPLPTQSYPVESRLKTVRYWVGYERPGGPGFTPNKEIDQMRWLPPDEASALLTYPRDADLIHRALHLGRTVPLVVLRHAQAVPRADYAGDDDARRPLTPQGVADAERLVGVLDAFGVRAVYSSDAVRCMETVWPFARFRRTSIVADPMLSEEGHARTPDAALQRVDELLAHPEPVVICTHRPVLPAVVERIAHGLGMLQAPAPGLAPAAALVFHRSPAGTMVEHLGD